jgi:hypothetical protein
VADLREGVDEAALGVAARHALHDEELVAAFAADSVDDAADADRARSLVDRCVACRDLHGDLVAIGGSIRLAATFTATAPRDFRLTEADAIRLGGRVSPRGFLQRLARAFAGIGQPLGASMAALGIVGLLVGSLGAGGAPAQQNMAIDAGASSAPGAEMFPGSTPGSTGRTTAAEPESTGGREEQPSQQRTELDAPISSGLVLTVASAILLVGGLGLIVLGVHGRRLRDR